MLARVCGDSTLLGRNRVSYRAAPAPEAIPSLARADTRILTREATTMALGPRRTSYQQLGLAVLGLTTFALGVPAAWAQIAVSANDNKIVNVDGTNQIVENPRPDTATIIDLSV